MADNMEPSIPKSALPDAAVKAFLLSHGLIELLPQFQGKKVHHRRKIVRFADQWSESDSEAEAVSPLRRKRNSRIYPIGVVKRMRCCVKRCVKFVEKEPAKAARKKYEQKDLAKQAKWVKTYLDDHHQVVNDKFVYTFFVGVRKICRTAWLMINGVTRAKFYRLTKSFQAGEKTCLPRNYHKRGTQNVKVMKSMAWLQMFASQFGDTMPDEEKINLPSSMTRSDVYDRMVMDMEDMSDDDQPCSRSSFFKLWKRDFPNITIPAENRFAKCNDCTRFKKEIMSESDKTKRRKIQAERDAHLKAQNAERQKYYKHIFKAKTNPQRYISLIIDAMDQKKTSIPREHIVSKFGSSMLKLATHVVGVIVHGRGNHLYVDMGEVPADSNSTANQLLQTLQKYVNQGLPPICYIQMDNTSGQNKNKYFFALCCMLIELNVFKKIKVSFLPVGHTHEDIDQFFSRISTYLKRFSVPTFSRLLALLENAVHKVQTTAERFKNIYNFRDWVDPCINEVHYHTRPHVFKFTKNEEGRACLQYKMWAATGESWKSCDVPEGVSPYLLLSHPDGHPEPVQRYLDDLQLKTILEDIRKGVKKQQMKEADLDERKQLADLLEKEDANIDDHTGEFALYDILPYNENLQEQDDVATEESESNEEPEVVVHLGRRPRHKRTVKLPLTTGKMVAVYSPMYPKEWPQIGKILQVSERTIRVQWFQGGVDTRLLPLRNSKDDILKDHIITQPFFLRKDKHLPSKIVKVLADKFHDYFE